MEKEHVHENSSEGPLVECLYFSAHWCPPCRGFTPQLAEVFTFINKHATLEELEANVGEWEKAKAENEKKKAEEQAKKDAPLIAKAKIFEEQYKAKQICCEKGDKLTFMTSVMGGRVAQVPCNQCEEMVQVKAGALICLPHRYCICQACYLNWDKFEEEKAAKRAELDEQCQKFKAEYDGTKKCPKGHDLGFQSKLWKCESLRCGKCKKET